MSGTTIDDDFTAIEWEAIQGAGEDYVKAKQAREASLPPISRYVPWDERQEETQAQTQDTHPQVIDEQENHVSTIEESEAEPFFTVLPESADRVDEIRRQLIESLEKSVMPPFRPQATIKNIEIVISRVPELSRIARLDRATGDIRHHHRYETADHLAAEVQKFFSGLGIDLPSEKAFYAIRRISHEPTNIFNSVVDALAGLGDAPEVNPLAEILAHITFGSEPAEIAAPEIFDLFFKKQSIMQILPTLVPRKYYPNDCCPGLYGPQGVGKTLLTKRLAICPDQFVESGDRGTDYFGSKDGMIDLAGADLVELGEFRGHRAVERIKSLISRDKLQFRKPYARDAVTLPRTCGFLATANGKQFLSDGSGNRRFFPLEIVKIDFSLFEKNDLFRGLRAHYRDWAIDSIKEAIREGNLDSFLFSIRPSDALTIYLDMAREDVREVSVSEDLILEYVERVQNAARKDNWSDFLNRTSAAERTEFFTQAEAALLIYPSGRVPHDFSKVFSETMTRLGFIYVNKRVGGRRFRHWIPEQKWNSGTVEHPHFKEFAETL